MSSEHHATKPSDSLRSHFMRVHRAKNHQHPLRDHCPPKRTSTETDKPFEVQVGILGAGMAGLYAALLLDSLKNEELFKHVTFKLDIIEAHKEHIGGRIFTYYFNGEKGRNAKKNTPEFFDYFDVGAMRYPNLQTMERVSGNQDWSLIKYLNERLTKEGKADKTIDMIPYYLSADNNVYLFNNVRRLQSDRDADDAGTHFRFNELGVPADYASQSYSHWLDEAFGKYITLLNDDFNKGFEELLAADRNSTRTYLRNFNGDKQKKKFFNQQTKQEEGLDKEYPEAVVQWCETMDSGTGLYDMAFVESIMDAFDFGGTDGWHCMAGGSCRMVDGLVQVLKLQDASPPISLQMGKIVTGFSPADKNPNSKINVNIRFNRSENEKAAGGAGEGEDKSSPPIGVPDEVKSYDHVISTLPLSNLRTINTDGCNISLGKYMAMRSLRYDHSCKVALHFKSRWWQDPIKMKGKHFFGGKSGTDLPVRTVVYPSYPPAQDVHNPGTDNQPAMIIASYTWSQDAARIGSLTKDLNSQKILVDICLNNLAKLHDNDVLKVRDEFDGQFFCWDWTRDPYAQGAFALYGPGQFTSLFNDITQPEANCRVHFAGEATSVHHAWVIGSLNSAYRSVVEILTREGLFENPARQKRFEDMWGTVDEVESRVPEAPAAPVIVPPLLAKRAAPKVNKHVGASAAHC